MIGQRLAPLRLTPPVAPSGRLRFDVRIGGLLEGQRLRRGEDLFEALRLAGLNRIVSGVESDATLEGTLPRDRQGDGVRRAEPKIMKFALPPKPEAP